MSEQVNIPIESVHEGAMKWKLHVEARNPCSIHGIVDSCAECLVGVYDSPDLATKQFAQWVQVAMLNTAQTITNTSGTGIAVTAGSISKTPLVVAGTGAGTAAVTDTALFTIGTGGSYTAAAGSGSVAASINAYSGSGTSGSFTITGTITNSSGGTLNYTEVGVSVTDSAVVNAYLVAHDTFSTLAVSNNGTLSVTYTATFQ